MMEPILGQIALLPQLNETEELRPDPSILLEQSTDVSSKTDSAISAWAVMPAFRLMGSDALYTSAMLRRMFSTLRSICCLARICGRWLLLVESGVIF